MHIYRFMTDPGHGWLEVPYVELVRLNIAHKVSPYSYRHGSMAYLEEDCDFELFTTAKERAGEVFGYEADYQEHTPIRGYARFS